MEGRGRAEQEGAECGGERGDWCWLHSRLVEQGKAPSVAWIENRKGSVYEGAGWWGGRHEWGRGRKGAGSLHSSLVEEGEAPFKKESEAVRAGTEQRRSGMRPRQTSGACGPLEGRRESMSC